MRICLINTQERWAGGERWFLWAASAMKERGHGVLLAAADGSALAQKASTSGIAVEFVGGLRARSLRRIFSQHKPDIVLCNGGGEARSAVRARRGAQAPKIVLRRGLCRDLGSGPVKTHFYRRLDGIFCNSEKTADVLKEAHPWLGDRDVTVMYNPVPSLQAADSEAAAQQRRGLAAEDNEVVILSVGRLDEDKGHVFLLEAFHEVLQAFPHTRLIIVGEGPEHSGLEEKVGELGLEDKVVLFGFTEQPSFFYRIADIFVMPSLPGYESFSNAALEAMSFGLPIVATTCGGFPELVDEGRDGLLVPPGDAQALAAALQRLVDDEGARGSMGDAARERVMRDFAPGQKAEELESYLVGIAQA
ncbi:glycosyltransferase [Planctomycetota bacterium]